MRNLFFFRIALKYFALVTIFVGFILSFQSVAYGQYDTYFLTVDPYANNGCINYYDTPSVHQVNDFIGVTTNPPPVLATFTGGRKVGSYFQSCMGMVGYATAHKDKNGTVTTLPNKININFNKAVKFKRIDIDGKFPQRVRVTIDGGASVEVDLDDETPGDGYGHKAVFVYDIFGSATPRRFSTITVSSADPDWRFGVYSIDYFDPTPRNSSQPPPDYCNVTTLSRPAPQNVSGFGWTMHSEVSDTDGLILTDVRLNGRLMAQRISVPYYNLETTSMPATRGELRPSDTGGNLRSRLVTYRTEVNDERLIVTATYAIDNIGSSGACLNITQRYEFLKEDLYKPCEPGNSFPCNQWRAMVNYQFTGNGETLRSLNIAQRNHFTINEFARNSVGLFRDCNSVIPDCIFSLNPALIFKDKINPLYTEFKSQVVSNGQDTTQWDNIHQTYVGSVSEPLENLPPPNFVLGGCPECVHSHWRWGKNQGEHFGSGKLLLPENTTQDLTFAIVRNNFGEEDPNDFASLINNEAIRFPLSPNAGVIDQYQAYRYFVPGEIVTWLSATGYKNSDEFFGFYSFFNSASPNITRNIVRNSFAPGLSSQKSINTSSLIQDAPTAITYGHLFADGATTYSEIDPNTVAALPAGYTAYNGISYDVRTEAEVSGPHTITFNLPTITDQTTFNNLRVLHSEPDPFDSSRAIWVDRTILPPDAPTPDFVNRNIYAKVNQVGPFLIATYTPPAPNTNFADLSVLISDSADPIVAGNQLTYTVNVINTGPNEATGVAFSDGLSPDVLFVSASAGQGSCREENATVICNLGTIASGASVSITIVVEPNEGQSRFPTGGKVITNIASVRANENDANQSNNTATESTTAQPNPVIPPIVQIQSPAFDSILTAPATFQAVVKAYNTGSYLISQVELFQDGQSIGNCGALPPGSAYCSITLNNVPAGEHSLVAVATNDGGRKAVSDLVRFYVNGPAVINLDSPAENALFGRPANITLTATATNLSGTISQVQFLADGEPIGNGVLSGTNQYNFTWNNAPTGTHLLRAIATDGNGAKSYSYATKISVTNAPNVDIVSPVSGTAFPKFSNVSFSGNARDFDGFVSKVDLYANGTSLLGTATFTQGDSYAFTWLNVPVGTWTVTAVATDNSGQTTVSSSVNITITNAVPTVSLASPTNGATFTAPANVTLSADALDSDGVISKVEFFRGTTLLGTAYSAPYNIVWNNVVAGNYNLTAKATDDDGAVTTSSPVSITVNPVGSALFVVGSTTLSSVDSAINTRLQNLGFTVVVKSATAATSADATGKRVVVISDSVTPTDVNTKFRTVSVPVMTLDPQLFDDMGMCATTTGNFGTTTAQKNVTITNASHPMAAGLSGTVQVTTANTTFGWGKINANGIKIATLTTDTTKATSFGYEANAVMPGLTAPRRRVGLFYTASSASLTANGGLLFDAAVKWVAGL